jgi:regulator of replication initiation timing
MPVTYTDIAAEAIARELGVSRMSVLTLETDIKLAYDEIVKLNDKINDLVASNTELRKTVDLLREQLRNG